MSSLKLKHSGGNSMSIEAPATNPASNLALKLPATIGSANQILKNSGTAGTLGWSSVVEDSSGKIGIGTTSPDGNLHVHDATAGSVTASTTGNIAVFEDSASNGISFLNPNTERATIYFGTTGTDGNVEASIQYAHEAVSTTADRRAMIFKTGGNSEHLRLDSGRNLLWSGQGDQFVKFNGAGDVVTIQTAGTNAANHGMLYFKDGDGAYCGQVTCHATNHTTSYGTGSDYRLKKNEVLITDGITRLKQLKPYRFKWKRSDNEVDGFFAHEAQTVVPEAITGTKDQVDSDNKPIYQGIDQSKLVPLLTAALQEAIGKIETLETKVAALEAA